MSNESESLQSLFKKEPLSEEQQEQFILGCIKRGKTVKNQEKKWLESQLNYPCRSFLQCGESDPLTVALL